MGFCEQFYTLYVSRPNEDSTTHSGLSWIPINADTPLESIRLHPELGPCYSLEFGEHDPTPERVQSDENDWALPYSKFRPATAAEREVWCVEGS